LLSNAIWKESLMSPPPESSERPTTLAVPVSDKDHAQGSAAAPITLVEYGDYECPDCLNAQPIIAQLRKHFGNRLRIVFRHFPQSSVHPRASAAALAAEAAGVQEHFWDMHEALFRHQKELVDLDLTHLALRIGLEVYQFQRDSESAIAARRIRDDYDGGVQSGVRGTPTFFINGRRYTGPADVEAMVAAMSAA
jgi:protein-disulfide isomerase